MSGIAGIFHIETAKPVDEARVRAMLAPMRHRGPGGSGVWSAPGVGLGHVRAASSEDGAQPMATAQGDIVVTCDGAITNAATLRGELEAQGHSFRTRADAEVLLHGWRQWGAQCVERLDGLFAFALFDARTHTLWLVRDRLGLKPLHVATLADGSLIFASELKGLLAHPGLRRTAELSAVADYLAYGYVPDDTSMVRGVRKLGAGEMLLAVRGRPLPAPQRYWALSFAERERRRGGALEEALREHLRAAVHAHMAAEQPVGAFLSGAVESSAVVALMAETSRQRLTTCTIGTSDESDQAERIARRFGTDHRAEMLAPDDLGLIDRIAAHADEPFAEPAALPLLRLCGLARESVPVALTGEGADEGFAGDPRHRAWYRAQRLRRLIPGAVRGKLPGFAGDGMEAYAAAVMVMPPALRAQLLSEPARAALEGYQPEARIIAAMRAAPARNALDRAQYADIRIALPADSLARMDRMGMAAGLEVRAPLLDHRLLEFAARLPVRKRLHGRSGKYLLRKAMEPLLPLDSLYRPDEGIALPLDDWFRGPLAGEARTLAGGSALARSEWFDMRRIARIAEAHRNGVADHGRLLWQLLMLDKALGRLFGLG